MMIENVLAMERDPQLTTSVETVPDGTARVGVRGELDLATAGPFRELLIAVLGTDRPDIVIDASQLHFCDSQGLAALVAAGNHAETLGGRITVVNACPFVAKVLRITDLDRRFTPPADPPATTQPC